MISPGYRDLNAELHHRMESYGTGGHRWAAFVRGLAEGGSVLDYGCGKGTLKQALADMDVREYDPAIPGKDSPPEAADVVVCGDVMEHVEPEFTRAVLADVCRLGTQAVFFVISCQESRKKLADGRGAHINVRPPEWWASILAEFGPFEPVSAEEGEFAAVWRKPMAECADTGSEGRRRFNG